MSALINDINGVVEGEWQAFQQTANERRDRMQSLESQLQNYYTLAGQTKPSQQLADRISETEAALKELRALEAIDPPKPVRVEEIREFADAVHEATESEDMTARRKILKQFVVSLEVDQKERVVEGKLLDPLSFGASKLVAPGGIEPPPRP